MDAHEWSVFQVEKDCKFEMCIQVVSAFKGTKSNNTLLYDSMRSLTAEFGHLSSNNTIQ